MSVTRVGVVQILFEGRYYFTQHRQSRGHYSRADTIRRVDTIQGNTVVMITKLRRMCEHEHYNNECFMLKVTVANQFI